jgi:hypothetical protein
MGFLAKNYANLLEISAQHDALTEEQLEAKVFAWFKKNLNQELANPLNQEFKRFKLLFSEFQIKIHIHSLANEFANKVTTKPYLGNPLYSTLDNQVKEPAEWALEQTTDTIGTSSPKAR